MSKARSAHLLRVPKKATPDDLIPRRVMNPTIDDHLEIMTRAIFQAGLSWAIISARWQAFKDAFEGFDVTRVAQYGEYDVDRLMRSDGVVHSAKKCFGTVENAKTLVALSSEFDSIEGYVARFRSYRQLYADAHERFAFLGDLSCYYWLFRTGNPVPLFETWIGGQPKDHPRMREMVLAGRADGTSTEVEGFSL